MLEYLNKQSRGHLYRLAQVLNVIGRSTYNKEELAFYIDKTITVIAADRVSDISAIARLNGGFNTDYIDVQGEHVSIDGYIAARRYYRLDNSVLTVALRTDGFIDFIHEVNGKQTVHTLFIDLIIIEIIAGFILSSDERNNDVLHAYNNAYSRLTDGGHDVYIGGLVSAMMAQNRSRVKANYKVIANGGSEVTSVYDYLHIVLFQAKERYRSTKRNFFIERGDGELLIIATFDEDINDYSILDLTKGVTDNDDCI